MKKCLYSAAPPGGLSGGVICALEHLCALRADFDQLCLILCEKSCLEAMALSAGVPVECIPLVFRGLRRAGPVKFVFHAGEVLRSRWRYLLAVRRRLNPNAILHVHSRAAHLPYALLAGWLARASVVVTIHEPGRTGQEAWFDWWMIRRFAHRVVFLTKAMQSQYPRLPEGRSFVIGNHAMPVSPYDGSHGGPPRLVMVASMTRLKGTDVFLRVCLNLNERGVSFAAEMVGGWPAEKDRKAAREYLKQNGLDSMVEIGGVLENMEPLYARMDILLLPTRRDSYPRVVMEAMCRGIPVVATRVDGIPEMVADGVTGFLVESGDVARFTDAVESLLKDPELRRRMGAAGRDRARALFSPETYRRKMLEMYAGMETGR